MASFSRHDTRRSLKGVRWPLRLTWAGMLAEQTLRCFWPLFALILGMLGLLMLGVQDAVPFDGVLTIAIGWCFAIVGAIAVGARRFVWPTRRAAIDRLDDSLPERPIQALMDDAAIGVDDPATMSVWRAHQGRMADRLQAARPIPPNPELSRCDPYSLRHAALLLFLVGILFGSIWRVGSVTEMTASTERVPTGPMWEGWVEPPRYTGQPTLYLNDISEPRFRTVEGSVVTLRLYGEIGDLSVVETLSRSPVNNEEIQSALVQEFSVVSSGTLSIEGAGGQRWDVDVVSDLPPHVALSGLAEASAVGEMSLPFTASDDYGIESGFARIELDLDAVERRYGLAVEPEPRDAILVPLPTPITGDRRMFTETLIEDFSQHPFSNLPVVLTPMVQDSLEQSSKAEPEQLVLPGRRFFDPMAAAVIEQRRDLLWSRENAKRISQVLRAVSHVPDNVFRSETAYLRLRFILRRLETLSNYGITPSQQDEIAQALWDLAVVLEEGDLSDALERMRRAQERLAEAMKNGASDQEIAELMQELRDATDDYLRQLAQEGGDESGERQSAENSLQMTQDDLQDMMDRIQELMEQGRMAEAEQALRELQEMMENMRVTQGQGNGDQSPGEQAMDGLAETLREQQGLSDQAFRDLQEQFNPDAQAGESQGNEGRSGGQGRGQSHEGENGQGQGQGERRGGQSEGQGDQGSGSLADRQQALRQELERQQRNLPGAGTPEGDAARDALGRAGRAMDGAEDALRQDDYAGAIDQQSEAMEALREGMRNLGEAMAQQQQNQPGQGTAESDRQAQNRDPLGRNQGTNGSLGSDQGLLQGEDVYRRARELLDEIRRRSGEGERPEVELEYLKRLLDRF